MNGLLDVEETDPVSVRRAHSWEVTHGSHFKVVENDIPLAITCVYSDKEALDFTAKAGSMRIQIGDHEPMLLVLNDKDEYDSVDHGKAS